MSNTLIHSTMRRGGHRPSHEVIALKVREYRRRRNLHPTQIKIGERRIIAHVLHLHFEFTPRQLADLLQVDIRTVRADLSIMQLHVKIYPHLASKVADLYDYIIYNARYIH